MMCARRQKKIIPYNKTFPISSMTFSLIAASSCLLLSLLTHQSGCTAQEPPAAREVTLSESIIIAEAHNDIKPKLQKETAAQKPAHTSAIHNAYEAFTGKITGNRVRLRLNPNLDSPIIREFSQGELCIVTGEVDDFYAILPLEGTKGYIFRTYVLDNVVEGNNVNLRLKPDTQSPVITQLGQGDKVQGRIAPENQKWLEIDLPKDVRFYVAKEYVQRMGNKSYFYAMEKKQREYAAKLASIQQAIRTELEKPFHEIQLAPLANELKSLSKETKDFPHLVQQVNAAITSLQENYLKLSMVAQTKPAEFSSLKASPKASSTEISQEDNQQTDSEGRTLPLSQITTPRWTTFSLAQQEQTLIRDALASETVKDEDDFYHQELRKSFVMKGIIVPYERLVQNRPGDYIIIDPSTKVPLAYLYSTRMSLKEYIGQPVTVTVVERPNHYFALPAYFVLDASNLLSEQALQSQ